MKYDLTKQGERWRALIDGHELISENGNIVKFVDGFAVSKEGFRYDLNANCWKLHTPESERFYQWIVCKPKEKNLIQSLVLTTQGHIIQFTLWSLSHD